MRIVMQGSGRSGSEVRYRAYLLTLLAVILGFTGVDRVALGLVVQNIKVAFHLTDSDIGILTGIAFAFFYSTFGIPLGRLADRGNRAKIIGFASALWGVMVMLSSIATSFGALLAIRVGVAVGESGCIPPAYSLISDYYDRSERPRAVSKYLLRIISKCILRLFRGWVAGREAYGWRVMFALLGCPGLLFAGLTWFTLKEPRLTQERRKGMCATAAVPAF